MLTVRNAGGATLNYTVSDDAGWLTVSPGQGASAGEPDELAIGYLASALPAGAYAATITLSDPNASNSPQTTSVTLTVLERAVPGDFDGDSDVDQEDVLRFRACVTGPDAGPPEPGCDRADLDADADVDQDDFGCFQRCMTGPGVRGDPALSPCQ